MELHPPTEPFSGVGAFFKRFFSVSAQNAVLLLAAAFGAGLISAANARAVEILAPQLSIQAMYVFAAVHLCGLIVCAYLTYVLIAIMISVQLGTTDGPASAAVWEGMRRLPRVIGYSLLMMLAVLAGFVCLVIPGIYLSLRLFPVTYVALFEPAENVFQRSWKITEYRAFEVFISLIAAAVATTVAGGLLWFIIGQVPAFPGSSLIGQTLTALMSWILPGVFWLLLYSGFRAEMPAIHYGSSPEAESVEAWPDRRTA